MPEPSRFSALAAIGQRLHTTLARLSPRERRAVTVAAWVLGLGLLWWLALSPALTTLRQAPEQHARLDQQLARMRGLAATAEALRAQNTGQPPGRDAVLRALQEANAAAGGTAEFAVMGDRVTLTFKGTTPEALARWMTQVRVNARLLPVQAQLNRTDNPAGWSGQMVLTSPGLGLAN
ncbi:type II secretion system protein GspM [Hydrogenophaga taeniospiralis]|nr:type II secretion system protein GspM [Hydrogenophaga taeniospiralis]